MDTIGLYSPHMAPSESMRWLKGRSSRKLFEEFRC